MTTQLEQAWNLAKQRFAAVGVDVEAALRQLDRLPVSMHCWQGDDVAGFENPGGSLTGGIQATGNYPGKARNATELHADLTLALSLIPGPKRLNLHAIYLESDEPVDGREYAAHAVALEGREQFEREAGAPGGDRFVDDLYDVHTLFGIIFFTVSASIPRRRA